MPVNESNSPNWRTVDWSPVNLFSSYERTDFTFTPPLSQTITPTISKQSIGVDINIISEDITKLLAYPAEKKTEVRVTIDGNTKEFTLDEFKKRLFGGFQGTFILKE